MSFPDSVINAFSTGTYSVSRPAVPTYDADGILVPGSPSAFNIDASVQPLSGADLQSLPEHRRTDNNRKIYTTTALQVGDQVTIDSSTWEVYNACTHGVLGTHYRAYVSELQVA